MSNLVDRARPKIAVGECENLRCQSIARTLARQISQRLKRQQQPPGRRLAVSFNDMAESLSRQITQLEEFGNLQRRFTSDVSQELRTPLTTVRMAADLIYDHSEDLEPCAERLKDLSPGANSPAL